MSAISPVASYSSHGFPSCCVHRHSSVMLCFNQLLVCRPLVSASTFFIYSKFLPFNFAGLRFCFDNTSDLPVLSPDFVTDNRHYLIVWQNFVNYASNNSINPSFLANSCNLLLRYGDMVANIITQTRDLHKIHIVIEQL